MLVSRVQAIAIAPERQKPLVPIDGVMAIAGCGLAGDRYANGRGSYQKGGEAGRRQVTLIDGRFLPGSGYTLAGTRRNIAISGDIDLMRLFSTKGGIEFVIGEARFRGVAYCDPCDVPSRMAGSATSFRDRFWSRGGLIAEVTRGGWIRVGSEVVANLTKY